MIDLKKLRDDPETFRVSLGRKRYQAERLDELLQLDGEIRRLKSRLETLRAERNATSRRIPQAAESEKAGLMARMREVAGQLKEGEPRLRSLEEALQAALVQIPNPPDPSAPDGEGETANIVLRRVGEPPSFRFEPLDHLALGESRGWIDMKRAARLSGSRFAYLSGDLVDLELALVSFVMDRLKKNGFRPVLPPVLVREKAMYGTGFFPADRNEIYKIENEDAYLVGTSEVSLAALHMDEILAADELPRRYAGFSTCFRREAGSYGKDTRGIFRVHQFDKVEMFSFCAPETSPGEHEVMLALQEQILQALNIPYRVVNIATGDLGAPAAKKFDLEAWMPGQSAYREVTSCSNCTDYQARRLAVRLRGESGTRLVHTLNGTAVAAGRMMIALLENHQQESRGIGIPPALQPYLGGRREL
ncbi:MAG: serine--tRNA ligase [Acidobacteriota bacterium]